MQKEYHMHIDIRDEVQKYVFPRLV